MVGIVSGPKRTTGSSLPFWSGNSWEPFGPPNGHFPSHIFCHLVLKPQLHTRGMMTSFLLPTCTPTGQSFSSKHVSRIFVRLLGISRSCTLCSRLKLFLCLATFCLVRETLWIYDSLRLALQSKDHNVRIQFRPKGLKELGSERGERISWTNIANYLP